jgi:hypothetical protein
VSATVVALLAVVAALPAAIARLGAVRGRRTGDDAWVPAVLQAAGLAVAGLLAALAAPLDSAPGGLAQVLGVLAAAGGAGPVVRLVFHLARRAQSNPLPVQDLLRGGAVIGVLERAAVAVTLLAGWPEGLAVVLAVKGLARYPELREARAGEQFIIGTFTSVLWAVGCWAVVRALLT